MKIDGMVKDIIGYTTETTVAQLPLNKTVKVDNFLVCREINGVVIKDVTRNMRGLTYGCYNFEKISKLIKYYNTDSRHNNNLTPITKYENITIKPEDKVITLERKIKFEEELAMKKFTIIADDMYEV